MTKKTKSNFTLSHGKTKIPVTFISAENMREMFASKLQEGETYCGIYTGMNPCIYINSSLSSTFSTILHELGEYVSSEYGLELSHEQLSVLIKVLADILIENKTKVASLLKSG